MPVVDPNSKDIDRKVRYHVRAGRKVFAVVSSARGPVDKDGNLITHKEDGTPVSQFVRVRCVVVKDLQPPNPKLDPPTCVGMSCEFRGWNTPKGAAGMARFARGLKFTTAFDTDDDEVWVNQVLVSNGGVFVGEVKTDSIEGNDGKLREVSEIESFFPYDGEKDPAWQELIDASFVEAQEAAVKREKRKASSGGSVGGWGGGRKKKSADSGDTDKYGF